jgi:predicted transcriptional regulator
MGELNRRVHVLLDDDRLERLRQHAEATGSSVGAVVRDAIDHALERDDRSAARAALESFPVGTPEELDRDLDRWWDEEID